MRPLKQEKSPLHFVLIAWRWRVHEVLGRLRVHDRSRALLDVY